MPRPRQWWYDDKGNRHACRDLTAFVRDHLKFPESITGDLPALIRRNLGWVSLTGGLTATVAYHERGVDAKAISALREDLGRWPAAYRVVSLDNGRQVRVGPELAADADRALVLAVVASRYPVPRRWHVTRLPLAAAPDHRLLAVYNGRHPDPLDVIGRAGMIPDVAILHRRDGAIHGVKIGARNPLTTVSKDLLTTNPLRSIPDVAFWEMTEACINETLLEGLTVRLLRGTVLGQRAEYVQIAMPANQNLYVSQTIPMGA